MRPQEIVHLERAIRRFAGCDALGCELNASWHGSDICIFHVLDGETMDGQVPSDPTRFVWQAALVADAARMVRGMHQVLRGEHTYG